MSKENTAIEKAKTDIEAVLKRCNAATLSALPALSQAVELASGMAKLQRVMTNDLINLVFMPLQGSPLGFLTDRDNARDGARYYPPEVVRDCVIEAMIKGLRPVGNEFNIISGRMYASKNGVIRLVKEFPGLTDLRVNFGVPTLKDGGALVAARASWRLDGNPMTLIRDVEKRSDGAHFDGRIAVRVNKMMGADAILGKASRKLHFAIYEMLTGGTFTLRDGEADVIDTVGEVVVERPAAARASSALGGKDGQRVSLPGTGKVEQPIDPDTGEVLVQEEPGALG